MTSPGHRLGAAPKWLCLLGVVVVLGCAPRAVPPPVAQAIPGTLDLRAWDPARDGPVELRGQWLVHWQQLLDFAHGPSDGRVPTPLPVPGQWVHFEALAAERAGEGAATYTVTLELAEPSADLVLRFPTPMLALKAWVNGKVIAQRGTPSLNAHGERVSFGEYVAAIPDGARTLTLVVQLSNHFYRTGGLVKAPLLGRRDEVQAQGARSLAGTLLFGGILLVIAIYHFGISLITPDSMAQRVLALNALAVGVHEVLVGAGGAIGGELSEYLPWTWVLRLEYFALYIALYLGVELNSLVFPAESRRPMMRIMKVVGATFALVPLVMPAAWYSRTLTAFSATALVGLLVVAYTLILAIKHGRPQARFILFALAAYLLANVHDVLAFHGVFSAMGEPRAPSILLFIGSQAWTLAKRFADAGQRVIELNEDLQRTNRSIARFVPSHFLAMLNRGSLREVERGDQVALTMEVLFCDIRNFTKLVELMPPGNAFRFINDYLSHMEPAIHAHGGFINQYLGDCIMALYPSGADAAVASAVEMLQRLERFNDGQTHSSTPLRVGIGINSGPLILGTIGGQERLDSGVVGDAVNLAARVESMTKLYGVSLLISEHTVARLSSPERFALRELDRVVPKGRTQSASIFEVLDVLPEATRALRIASRADFARGLSAFREARFDEAQQAFAACALADPTDAAAQLYLTRCRTQPNSRS